MAEPRRGIPTRALLLAGAFAALQALLFLAVVPLTTMLAATAPPAYALVAGIHSLLPFLARLVTAVPGAAIVTAAITGLLTAALSPIGLLTAVPMVTAAVVFDGVMPWRTRRRAPWWRVLLAAAAAGVALFVVSLPVFSSEHLTAPILIATLAGRIVGEAAAGAAALAFTAMLSRAGVVRRGTPAAWGERRGEAGGEISSISRSGG